jgi:choline transport protein
VLSLGAISLYISYIIPVAMIIIRKLEGRHPAYGPFKLGHWGIPINLFAVVYATFIVVFASFPVVLPVTAQSMDYAAPVWFAVLLFALGDWFFSGRRRFTVPVRQEEAVHD